MNPTIDKFVEDNDITDAQAYWAKNAKADSKMNRQFEEAFTKASNEAAARIVADTRKETAERPFNKAASRTN